MNFITLFFSTEKFYCIYEPHFYHLFNSQQTSKLSIFTLKLLKTLTDDSTFSFIFILWTFHTTIYILIICIHYLPQILSDSLLSCFLPNITTSFLLLLITPRSLLVIPMCSWFHAHPQEYDKCINSTFPKMSDLHSAATNQK